MIYCLWPLHIFASISFQIKRGILTKVSINIEDYLEENYYLTASTAASAGPLMVTKVDSMRRRYPCSGAIK